MECYVSKLGRLVIIAKILDVVANHRLKYHLDFDLLVKMYLYANLIGRLAIKRIVGRLASA
jgi:hypothetical protein